MNKYYDLRTYVWYMSIFLFTESFSSFLFLTPILRTTKKKDLTKKKLYWKYLTYVRSRNADRAKRSNGTIPWEFKPRTNQFHFRDCYSLQNKYLKCNIPPYNLSATSHTLNTNGKVHVRCSLINRIRDIIYKLSLTLISGSSKELVLQEFLIYNVRWYTSS